MDHLEGKYTRNPLWGVPRLRLIFGGSGYTLYLWRYDFRQRMPLLSLTQGISKKYPPIGYRGIQSSWLVVYLLADNNKF